MNTTLRLADLNYQSAEKPLKPYIGVFKRTTGLLVYIKSTISNLLRSSYILVIFIDTSTRIGIQSQQS
jgi:hypothetical protein